MKNRTLPPTGPSEGAPVESTNGHAQNGDAATPEFAPLKALSLWQPWASLIAIGAKRIETRSWSTDLRGTVAIHATKTLRKEDANLCCNPGPIHDAMKAAGFVADNATGDERTLMIPYSCIVAVADIVDCIEFTEGFDPGEREKHFGDFTSGRFGFKLANIRPLKEPVACAGGQKFWTVDEETTALVMAQVGDALPEPAVADSLPIADPAVTESPAASVEDKPGSANTVDAPDPTTWAMIQDARADESEAEEEVAELSESLKSAKKRHEAASLRLGKLIDEARFPTLFTPRAVENIPETASHIPETVKSIPDSDESWRAVKLDTLTPAIPPGKLKILAENTPPITTLGELSDFQAKAGDWWIKNIKGLGAGGAEAIENAAAAFWAANPRPSAPATETAPVIEASPAPVDGSPDTAPADFADDAKMAEQQIVLAHTAEHSSAGLEIARRGNGQWAHRIVVSVAGVELTPPNREYQGGAATADEAKAAGLDAIDVLAKSCRTDKKPASTRNLGAKELLTVLEGLMAPA